MSSRAKLPKIQENTDETGVGTANKAAPPLFLHFRCEKGALLLITLCLNKGFGSRRNARI